MKLERYKWTLEGHERKNEVSLYNIGMLKFG
jgi:hypothetical protein